MRLDQRLVADKAARSRSHAAGLIRAGEVQVDGVVDTRPGRQIADTAQVTVRPDPYVSRAAHKLLGALRESGTPVPPRCLDAGASTGGFTQVLLERGAQQVYSVDVGHGQLADSIRDDPRVTVWERTHLRDLTTAHLDGKPVDLVVADVSFISLLPLLPSLLSVVTDRGTALLMVKPQFEVGRERLGAHGVVTDPHDRTWAVDQVSRAAAELGWRENWRGTSELAGETGNVEVFLRLGNSRVVSDQH